MTNGKNEMETHSSGLSLFKGALFLLVWVAVLEAVLGLVTEYLAKIL